MTNTKPESTETKCPALTVYEVQTHTLCDGWVNTWMYEDGDGKMQPETFPTCEAAQEALNEYLEDLVDDVALGNISDYDREDFRIHLVFSTATGGNGSA